MSYILGISAFYHDSAACIVSNGRIMAAAQEERFNRQKHSAEFPVNAIRYCLDEVNIKINDLDAIVFYEKPFLKFERLLQTYYSFAPKGIVSFLKAVPTWLDEKLFLKNKIKQLLKEIEPYDQKKLKLLFSSHHLSHAASAYYPSPFDEAAVITIDGVGEWNTTTISYAKGATIEMIKEMSFPHSVGLLYSAFTYYLGFTVNSGEYKVMGLAPFGNGLDKEVKNYIDIIKKEIVSIKNDGSIWLNQEYFNYATGLKMIHEQKWLKLFGVARRLPESKIEQQHCNLAYAIQNILEEIVLKMVIEAKKLTNSTNLCLAGGVALNCVANSVISDSRIFENIFIQPAAGDSGGALGAALAAYYMYYSNIKPKLLKDKSIYLGPRVDQCQINKLNLKFDAIFKKHQNNESLCDEVAKLLSCGKIVGWFQGRMEFGPRALGNRSILADPRNPDIQGLINRKIKYREEFRPFAPAVIQEYAQRYFEIEGTSPYMLYTAKLKPNYRRKLPDRIDELSLEKKILLNNSMFPAVTHFDYSSRIQTVSNNSNPKFWLLLQYMQKYTGHPMILNTSFNVRGEPIVCTAEEAFHCFMSTDMDVLVIEDFLYLKEEQKNNVFKIKFEFD